LWFASIGKFFGNNGNIYEREWKDDKKHGQGKDSYLFNDLLILSLFNALIGKKYWINGNKYEGKWKDGTMNG